MKSNNEIKKVEHNASIENRRLLPMWLFRILTAIAFDIVITLILTLGALRFSGAWYNSHHAIPDPIERGTDLGLSIFGFSWAFLVLIVSFPVLFFSFYKSIKKYLKDY